MTSITNEQSKMKFIDLFCGIGGFHQALGSLGHECILASDKDKKCRESYERNYKMKPNEDVYKIDEKTMGDFDILCGGFPCQPFSNGGKKKTFDDDRGLLFDEIIRIAKHKKPRFMFLENVKHILKVGNGEVIKYIKEKLDKTGYHLQMQVMSPHHFGIPQQRERVYFICIRKDIYDGTDVELKIPDSTPIELEKFMQKKEEVDERYFVKGIELDVLKAWNEMINAFEVDERISPTILINDEYRNYSLEEYEKLAAWRKDYMEKNQRLITKYRNKFDEWYKKHKTILLRREIYGKLEWQVGRIKPNDSIFNYFIQMRQSGIRVKKAEYFPTLVAMAQIPIYGKQMRRITPRECARLQSFPESFILDESDQVNYKQFGNSVNVDNVKFIIENTLKHYNLV